MSSSTSPSKLRFLFDENVDKRLERVLKKQGVNITSKPKGLSNGRLAEFSKTGKFILVTNDEDFVELTNEEIFSIVWLRIPQRDIDSLIRSFSKLLKEKTRLQDFEGFLIMLKPDKFESVPLFRKFKPVK